MIRLFGFDLDGTLLTPEKAVSSFTKKVLKYCAEKHILLVPVTGRPLHGIPESVRSLPYLTHLICSNGAMTVDLRSGRVLRRRAMSLDLVLDILRRVPEREIIREVFIDGYGYHDADTALLWKKRNLIPAQRLYLKESRREVRELTGFLQQFRTPESDIRSADFKPADVSEEYLAEDVYISTDSSEIQKEILARMDDLKGKCHIVESFPTDLEFGALHADKGEAFLQLASDFGVAMNETAAFGDGGNDIDLLKAAGTAAAMGNAIPKVKDMADFITEDNAHDGVAKGILQLLQ